MFDNLEVKKELNDPLTSEKQSCFKKHLITILILAVIIILAIFITIIIVVVKKDDKDDVEKKAFKILKSDKDFQKPDIKLNAEFQLIKVNNGMTGLLINDPFSEISTVFMGVQNGYFMDTVNGIAHFDEHMMFGGSEKYANYSFEREVGGAKGYDGSAYTAPTYQVYYSTVEYNFNFGKSIDILTDAFKYPLYNEEIIKKEIQPVNSEFYAGINSEYFLLEDIIRQLSSIKTSMNGMGCGNNDTLKPSEADKLSKILKGYHMVVNRPEKVFFVLYSNETMKNLQNYVEKYFNYKMHEFSNKEIDVDDKKQLETNIENLKNLEIFDEKLYQHGIYYNSESKKNLLNIFFYLGNINYIDLKFQIIDYFSYLFNSKSLIELLKEKKYISSMSKLGINLFSDLEYNTVIDLPIELTEFGLNNVNDVLLIIYKYIDIMKKEGFKKKYFDNFVKYKNGQIINMFNKNIFTEHISSFFDSFFQNYKFLGEDQILKYGAPTEENYDQDKLTKYLNNIKSEKSFFVLNTISDVKEIIKNETFLNKKNIVKLNYYNVDFLLGEYPEDFKNDILNDNIKYDELLIREINPYFSSIKEKVIPCYKEKINKCKELNEFDYNNENEYNATLLDDNDNNYKIYYQIDKSSESNIVNSYLKIEFKENKKLSDLLYNSIEQYYIIHKLSQINELETIFLNDLTENHINFIIKSFSDNTEKIIKDLINFIIEEPEENEFNYTIESIKSSIIQSQSITFKEYLFKLGEQFMNGGKNSDQNITQLIEMLENIQFDDFKDIHNEIVGGIKLLTFKIAGNIDTNLVNSIYSFFKEKIIINPTLLTNVKINKVKSSTPFIYNYYQKSTMIKEVDNGVLVIYEYDEQFKVYMDILKGCFDNIAMINLRFNYSNAYHPRISIDEKKNLLFIFEQGKFKEIPQMEDDINEVLLGMLNGNVLCENYPNIVESYKLKGREQVEKTPDNLFYNFIQDTSKNGVNEDNLKETVFPKTFIEFMKEIDTIFLNPRRYTILVVRNGISDGDFEKMFEDREKNSKYILNKEIEIKHTKLIDYLKDK